MMYDIFDAHCDTLYELRHNNKNENLTDNTLHFKLSAVKEYNNYIQLFALWSNPKKGDFNAFSFMDDMLCSAVDILNKSNIKIVKNKKDLNSADKFKAIIGIEGADALSDSLENLKYFFNKGVRLFTLTWNGENHLGYGCLSDIKKGLKPFGFEAVREMNEYGVVIDVSHLNEKGFYDVINTTNKPVIASHSNSAAICKNKRNITDNQFKALIENGGVVGINLYPLFLSNEKEADIDTVVSHIEHFMSLGGENHIGLGSDFDGISKLPVGINTNKDLYYLFKRLNSLNYTKSQINKITFKNFFDVFNKVLK